MVWSAVGGQLISTEPLLGEREASALGDRTLPGELEAFDFRDDRECIGR